MEALIITSLTIILPCIAILTLGFTLIVVADILIYLCDSITSRF